MNDMRWPLLFFVLVASVAQAGTLEICGRKEKTEAGLTSCVEAQRKRTANLLRGLNATVLETVTRQAQESGDKTVLREYQLAQGQHLRNLTATCGGLAGNERTGCEADLTYAHMESLHRFLPKENTEPQTGK
jgi:hypothetical protein